MNDTRIPGSGPGDLEAAGALVLRPCRIDDLPAIEAIADVTAVGITSMPVDRAALRQRVERAVESFASEDAASGEESYLFLLEDTRSGRIVGTSGIAASAGFSERFYSYRSEFVVHASPALGVANRIHTLHLCHDLSGYSLLTSFYIEPAYEHTAWPQLLSRARLLYIDAHRERFADRLAAESPGPSDDEGHCPFWAAVGERCFDMDYTRAEALAGGRSKSFIAELMPQAPIYVPLLPESAQMAIGQLHPVAELPFSILMDEGFDADTYVDVFDGGPTAEARFDLLRTVRHARAGRSAGTPPPASAPWQIVAGTGAVGFRATLTPALATAQGLQLPAVTAQALHLVAGDPVRHVLLDLPVVDGDEVPR